MSSVQNLSFVGTLNFSTQCICMGTESLFVRVFAVASIAKVVIAMIHKYVM